MTELKPNLTKVTREEYRAIMDEASEALGRGDRESFYKILKRAPLDASQANEIKRFNGVETLIADGFNLSAAVEVYGEEWLHN